MYQKFESTYGMIKGVLRIKGREVYLRQKDKNPQVEYMIQQLRGNGAEILKGEKWIKIDMFKQTTLCKLGEKEFDVDDCSEEEIEQTLFDFFKSKYEQAKFKVDEIK